jgi:glycosyltransferase involved in cell wall biosynthesis
MRILIITQYFWPENFRVNDLCLELKSRGHEITVITGLPNYPNGNFMMGYTFFNNKTEFWQKIKVIRTKLFPRKNGKGIFLFINYFSFAFFSTIKIFFLKSKFDNIIVYQLSPGTVGIPGIIAKLKFNIPLFFYIQDIWPESLRDAGNIKSKYVLNIIDKMMLFFYKNSDKILVQSEGFIDFLVKKGVPFSKLFYLPNTVESFYKPVDVLNKYKNQMPNGFIILFAGNIGFAQDLITIIKAAKLLQEKDIEVNWVFIGDGRAKNYFLDQVISNNLSKNFHFLGIKPSEEMPYYFACADVLLVSLKKSLIFSLTIPSKVQSYLACKKPIIANIDGIGAQTIIKSKSGLVSNSGDYVLLASNIEQMTNKSVINMNSLSQNGYNYFLLNFERKIIYDKLESLLRSLYV